MLESVTWHDVKGDKSISRNEEALNLSLDSDPERRWQIVLDVDLVTGSEVPRVQFQEEGVVETSDPWQIRADSAYLDLRDVLMHGLDIRVGRQVVSWGAADVFNPTDALAAKSFEDPGKFGENLPSPSLNIHYTFGGLDLNLIYVDKFQAPRLPGGLEEQFFSPSRIPPEFADLAAPFLEGGGSVDVTLNAQVPSDSLFGVRLSGSVTDFDYSISYSDTRETIPVLHAIDVTRFDPDSLTAAVTADLFFPKKKVYGVDIAGQLPFLGNAGAWAEAAWNVPEADQLTVTMLGTKLSESEILADPYLKVTVGSDYTLGDGYLVQGQIVRGFVDEADKESLSTYVIAGFEKSYFADAFRVRFFETYDLDDGGLILNPDLLWSVTDKIQVGGGGLLYKGSSGAKLKETPSGDSYFLRFRYAF